MAVISVWSQSRESTHGSAGQALLEKCSPRTMFFRINENVHGRDHAPLTVAGSPKKCILFSRSFFHLFFFFFLNSHECAVCCGCTLSIPGANLGVGIIS